MKPCFDIQVKLLLAMGDNELDDREKVHLLSCPDCTNYLEELIGLGANLRELKVHPLTPYESARMQAVLDEKINNYQSRAQKIYNFALRYSAMAAAVALVLFIVLVNRLQFPGFSFGVQTELATTVDSTSGTALSDNVYTLSDEDVSIDEPYLHVVVADYIRSYGFNTGDLLLGDLSAEELEYLKNNLKVGDIL